LCYACYCNGDKNTRKLARTAARAAHAPMAALCESRPPGLLPCRLCGETGRESASGDSERECCVGEIWNEQNPKKNEWTTTLTHSQTRVRKKGRVSTLSCHESRNGRVSVRAPVLLCDWEGRGCTCRLEFMADLPTMHTNAFFLVVESPPRPF